MGRPRYRILMETFWTAREWTSLEPGSARELLLFLAVGPLQRRVPGVAVVGEGELSDKLGWKPALLKKSMGHLAAAGACEFDRAARFAWMPWRYDHEPPRSPDVVRGWRQELESWPSCDLAQRARLHLRSRLAEQGPEMVMAFDGEATDGRRQVEDRGGPSPLTLPGTLGGDPPSSTSPVMVGGDQRFRDSEIKRAGETKSPAADEQPPVRVVVPVDEIAKPARRKPRKVPTPKEQDCRKAARDRIDAEYFKRVGEPFEWGAEEGKENTGVSRLATLCKNDIARVNIAIDTAIAMADAGDPRFADISPCMMASKINILRAWAQAHPGSRSAPRSRTEDAPPASVVLAKMDETRQAVAAEKAAGVVPPRPPGAAKPRLEVGNG